MTADVMTDAQGNRFLLRPQDCPTCGPLPRSLWGIRGGRYHRYGLGIESPIVRCEGCGLLFPDPFPVPMDVQKLYGDPEKYFAAKGDFWSRSDSYRSLIRKLQERTGKTDPAILDVGSGRGELLRAAQLEGISRAVGLELSEAMIDEAAQRGLEVLAFTVEDYAALHPERFDAIVLNAVVEHVDDPDSMMSAATSLSNVSGLLYIDIPNEPNLLSRLARLMNRLGRSPAVIDLAPTFPPYHVWGFNRQALTSLLAKHGWSPTDFHVRAGVRARHDGSASDRVRALAASALLRLANATGTAHNMTVWARRDTSRSPN